MKLMIVTRRLPPARCGVGDYTARLAEAFQALSHDVVLVTGADQRPYSVAGRILPEVPDWGRRGMTVLRETWRRERPDRILFQWAPFLYHPRGWNFWVGAAAWRARADGLTWHTMVHEPFVDWEWTRVGIMALGQRLALGSLISASRRAFTPVTAWVSRLRADFPGAEEKVFWSPVGSTIRPTAPTAEPHEGLRVGVFSPLGAGKDPAFVEAVWEKLKAREARMVCIGITREQWPGVSRSDERWTFTGPLAEGEVSRAFRGLDVFLAPFVDGVSARRTTALTALAHGVCTVTNAGRLTDPILLEAPWQIVRRDPGDYARAVLDLWRDPAVRRRLGEASRAFYAEHFDWPKIAADLLSDVATGRAAA